MYRTYQIFNRTLGITILTNGEKMDGHTFIHQFETSCIAILSCILSYYKGIKNSFGDISHTYAPKSKGRLFFL